MITTIGDYPNIDSKEYLKSRLERAYSQSTNKNKELDKKKLVSVSRFNDLSVSQIYKNQSVNISEYKDFVAKNLNKIKRTSQSKRLNTEFHTESTSNKFSNSPITQSRVKLKMNRTGQRNSFMSNQSNNRFMNGLKQFLYEHGTSQYYKVEQLFFNNLQLDVEHEHQPFLMKVVQVDEKKLWKELYFLNQLRHPNIIGLKHYFILPGQNNNNILHMIFPWVPCTVQKLLEECPQRTKSDEVIPPKPITPNLLGGIIPGVYNKVQEQYVFKKTKPVSRVLLKLIIYQIIRGVAYLHSKRIAHRDLNPANIVVDLETLNVFINDLTSAKTLIKGEVKYFSKKILSKHLTVHIGDPSYRAPELLLGASEYDTSIDLWSLGCLIAEIYYGKKLFEGKNSVEVFASVIKIIGTPSNEELIRMKTSIRSLNMPKVKRQSLNSCFNNFNNHDGLPELLEGLLTYLPDQRTSAFNLLLHPFFQEIKHQSIRINQKSLPNVFNFTKEELKIPIIKDNLYRLVPDWYQEKQKRNEYLETNYDDALLMLKS